MDRNHPYQKVLRLEMLSFLTGDKAIDRSPCGTGTSARMAQWFAKGFLQEGEVFIHESIIGSIFKGRVEAITAVGSSKSYNSSIEGSARITGYNSIILDDSDPILMVQVI